MKGIWGKIMRWILARAPVVIPRAQVRSIIVDGGYSTKSVNQNKVYFFSVMVEKFFWTKRGT